MSVPKEKEKLRAELRQRIAALTPDYIKGSNRGIIQNILSYPCYREAKTVFCFVGTASEINTSILIGRVFSGGKRVAIPLCIGKSIMETREIHSLVEPHSRMMGTLEPTADSTLVTPAEIDFAILPCVSCDKQGNRLGYGGDYYDRFLGQASLCSVLICRERLLCEQIPTEPHDTAVPVVITETDCFSREQIIYSASHNHFFKQPKRAAFLLIRIRPADEVKDFERGQELCNSKQQIYPPLEDRGFELRISSYDQSIMDKVK